MGLTYRGVEYTLVQGLGRQVWKWSVPFDETTFKGQAATKIEAVHEAERSIERALAPKKLRLVPPSG
jgi:hypothetical protein